MDPLILILELLALSVAGALVGFAMGLVPGLHVNNLALGIVAAQGPALALFGVGDPSGPLLLSAFVVSAAVAQPFGSLLPAVFLGAADEATALSTLPGHRMLREGRGLEAVALSVRGAVLGTLGALALLLPLRLLMGDPVAAYERLQWAVALVLVLLATLLILSERARRVPVSGLRCLSRDGLHRRLTAPGCHPALGGDMVVLCGRVLQVDGRRLLLLDGDQEHRILCEFTPAVNPWDEVTVHALSGTRVRGRGRQRLLALGLFLLAGGLGWVVLNGQGWWEGRLLQGFDPSQSALLPLLSGLFGVPTLLLGRTSGAEIPPQVRDRGQEELPLWRRVRGLLSGCVAGATLSWFPAVSGGTATLVAQHLAGGHDESPGEAQREFLFSSAAVAATVSVFSIAVLFVTGRTRSGAAAAVDALNDLHPWTPVDHVPLLLAVLLVAAVVATLAAFPLTLWAGDAFARLIPRVPMRRLSEAVLVLLGTLVLLFAGPLGVLVLVTAAAVGLLPPMLGVRRVHLMGALLVPVILGAYL